MTRFEGEKYRPSNGSEGMWFESKFCDKCKHFKHDNEDDYCEISLRAMVTQIEDSDYPKEWIYDKNEGPTCTAFEKEKQ